MRFDSVLRALRTSTIAVLALAEEAKSRGFDRLTALWEPGEDSPEEFFLRVGFTIVGETQYGENIGALVL